MTSDTFTDIKQRITESFTGIQEGVNGTIGETDIFINMISPYVDYFFAGRTDDNSFIGDVVFPSRRDLAEAMLGATGIMEGDSMVHESVFDSVSGILRISDSVTPIIEMLEAIEIYSLNTMVISGKSGDEGLALATISSKMAQLSRQGNGLSEMIRDKMEKLTESLDRFHRVRDVIEGLHENNLTMIQMKSVRVFKELLNEFNNMSGDVLGEFNMIRNLNDALKGITGKFQHEDLVRQGLEKIGYIHVLADSDDGRNFADYTGTGRNIITGMFSALAVMKTEDVRNYVNTLHNELEKALKDVSSVMELFSGESGRNGNCKASGDMLDRLYAELENLKKQFEEYIHEILKQKEDMQEYLKELLSSLKEFSNFFSGIMDISRTFKTIILMTQIELSRHDVLKSLLAGSLSDVKKIPDRINDIVSVGMKQYEEIETSLKKALELYHSRFNEQKGVLEQSTQLIRNVSVQVFESKKYHDVCLLEIVDIIRNVKELIDRSMNHLDEFMSAGKQLKYENTTIMTREGLMEKYGRELNLLYDYFNTTERSGDYRSMMIASISSEYREKPAESGTIEFF